MTNPPDEVPLVLADAVEKLDLAFRLRSYHHNALWEEQKHFTWLISIILSAQLIILTGVKLSMPSRISLILVASAAGSLLSFTAFRVQRKEGEYFLNANVRFVMIYNSVYPEAPVATPGLQANKDLWNLVLSTLRGRSGVRDYFQFLFLAFIAIFFGMAVFAFVVL